MEQIPAKLNDFADKELLQHIEVARFLFGLMTSPPREMGGIKPGSALESLATATISVN